MISQICSSLKAALVTSFGSELEVKTAGNRCVITLPLRTADERYIDVFVESMTGSGTFTYVHDGGKNTAELYAQGIHPTDSQDRRMKGIALAYGAQLYDGRFQILCKSVDEILTAVFAVAQCASLAMADVPARDGARGLGVSGPASAPGVSTRSRALLEMAAGNSRGN
jgi:hypothetical protein